MQIVHLLGDAFNLLLLQPSLNAFVLVVQLFQYLHIPGALGFSIIALTLAIRFILWPLSAQQTKSMKKLNDLKPKLNELKKKHGEDKMAFNQAQMDLFKQEGYNPAAGCLPGLVQVLLIAPLYQVFGALLDPHKGLQTINYFIYNKAWALKELPDSHFLGINLVYKPSEFQQFGFWLLLIPVITAVLTFVQSKMMAPKPLPKYPSDSPKEKKEKDAMEDAQETMQGQMTFMMPLVIGYASFNFPIGLALYWNTMTILGIWQQYRITGWGSLGDLVSRFNKKPETKVIKSKSKK